MKTLLVREDLISRFNFWRDGQVWVGMMFRNELFRRVSQFDSKQRHKVFELAWNLSHEGSAVVITAERSQYTVWVSFRASNLAADIEQPVYQQFAAPSKLADCPQPGFSIAARQSRSLEPSLTC